MSTFQISLNRYAIVQTLAVLVALLMSISLLGQISRFEFGHDHVFGLVQLFNVEGERNIPTFFTVMVALSNAVLLVVIGLGKRPHAKTDSFYWFALAAGFVFLSYDEAFQVHEQMEAPMRALMANSNMGLSYYSWVVPGMVGVGVLALCFLKFLLRLPTATRHWMIAAACLYFGGCLGMEIIGGNYFEAHGAYLMYNFLVTIEEGLEMAGLSTLVFALLGHIAGEAGKVEFRVEVTQQMKLVPVAARMDSVPN